MGVRLTSQERVVALFDSVSGFAFGPTFPTEERADQFLGWWKDYGDGRDLRQLSDPELESALSRFVGFVHQAEGAEEL